MAKGSRLVDRIAADVQSHTRRPTGFWGRLTPEQQAELLEVRRLFQSGALRVTGNTLAKTLKARCDEEGIPVCGHDGLREWLARKD